MLAFGDIKRSTTIVAHFEGSSYQPINTAEAVRIRRSIAVSTPGANDDYGASPLNALRVGAHGRALAAWRGDGAGRVRPARPAACVHDRDDDAAVAARQ